MTQGTTHPAGGTGIVTRFTVDGSQGENPPGFVRQVSIQSCSREEVECRLHQ